MEDDAATRNTRETLQQRLRKVAPRREEEGLNRAQQVTTGLEEGTLWPDNNLEQRKRGFPRFSPVMVRLVMALVALGMMILYFWLKSFMSISPADTTKPPTTMATPSLYLSQRFPLYGTPAFSQKCPWVTEGHMVKRSEICTILVEPRGGDMQEGIAEWVSNIASWFLIAKQAGCEIKFQYYPNVDLSQVMESSSITSADFQCEREQHCFRQSIYENKKTLTAASQSLLGQDRLAPVPQYRWEYSEMYFKHRHVNGYEDLRRKVPSFSLESGMACSLGSLFPLSPLAAQFEPFLFEKILPVLHDPSALVMALYVRTGRADEMATAEERGQVVKPDHPDTRSADGITGCALQLEQEYLGTDPAFTKVVWLVISDSPATKQWIVQKHANRTVRLPEGRTHGNATISTEILTTRARGIHTRGRRNPSTRDFAEAFLDWFLLGESDLVIARGSTFGATGALRTARPLHVSPFNSGPCTKATFVNQIEGS